jgi:hypothetical protein
VQTTPDPGGTKIDVAENDLAGLGCSSSASCWAAGSDGNLTGPTELNEILHWNGKKWSTVTVPNPDGSNPGANNALYFDTCVSASDCWAVGTYGSGNVYSNEVVHWNGHKWIYAIAPNPGANNALYFDTCVSASDCWAVGTYGSGNVYSNEVVHWNGHKWIYAIAPNPGATAEHGANVLAAVRCVTAANCWTVGLQNKGKRVVDQVLHWNGRKWFAADNTIVPF